MKNPNKITFIFKLTALQAQTIHDAVACFREEPELMRNTGWEKKSHKKALRNSATSFNRQLNKQYAATGVEVWPQHYR